MPQRSLHPLVYILLMWLTIISIVQVVFIAFFFTLGQNGQSSSHRAEEPGGTSVPLVAITSPTTKIPTDSEKGKVINYQTSEVNASNIFWVASHPEPILSDKGEQLLVKRDGYFFLSLRVTLGSDPGCLELKHTVTLKYGGKPVLEGWIDNKTCSSGQLSRVKALSEGEKLEITIDPPTTNLNRSSAVTYLDIIFIPKSSSYLYHIIDPIIPTADPWTLGH